jgi:hypothetical protein
MREDLSMAIPATYYEGSAGHDEPFLIGCDTEAVHGEDFCGACVGEKLM